MEILLGIICKHCHKQKCLNGKHLDYIVHAPSKTSIQAEWNMLEKYLCLSSGHYGNLSTAFERTLYFQTANLSDMSAIITIQAFI